MTNPTERPEERDSLAEIEKRLVKDERNHTRLVEHDCVTDRRTLINEVKEREAERAMWERASRNATSRILDLEAEVKELREENARLQKRLLGTSR